MTTTSVQHQTVTIGAPIDELPHRRRQSSSRWDPIAAEARNHPGRWIPIRLNTRQKALSTIVGHIKRGKYVAFRDGDYQAAQREGVLYVRYDGPANVTPIHQEEAA